jgi:pimeloyl-ACP methyl ester carboxylesterase
MYQRAQGTADSIPESDQEHFRFLPPFDPAYRAEPHTVGFQDDTPGFIPPPSEDKTLIIFVHGCCVDAEIYKTISDTAFKRLWWQGYRGRFASFRWPAIQGLIPWLVTTYNEQEFRAWKYGQAFRDYIAAMRRALPDYAVNVFAHSQGNIVVGEALKLGASVENYVLSQPAVPADCYDGNPELIKKGLERLDRRRPAPYLASEMGYAGYFADLASQRRMVNLFNPKDSATGLAWESNNKERPDQGFGIGAFLHGRYIFDAQTRQSQFERRILDSDGVIRFVFSHVVTDPHDSMAFIARSRTQSAGTEGRTRGPIDDAVNLQQEFGLTRWITDHGAQFDRTIQDIHGYYRKLLEAFGWQ